MKQEQRQFLKGKLVSQDITLKALAKHIGISYIALYRKMKGLSSFTVPEIESISKLLKLSAEEMNYIFFAINMS